MTSFMTPRRLGVALASALALLAATAAAAFAGASSYGPAPASFFYDDGQYAVFAGPGFDVATGCQPADDLDAHFVSTGAGTVHTQGQRDVESVTVYDMEQYDATTPLDILIAICFLGAEDDPLMTGDGTVWFNNTNCEPGPDGCYQPGSSWTGKNWLRATVEDGDGVEHDVRAFARVEVDLTGPPTETLLDMRVRIR